MSQKRFIVRNGLDANSQTITNVANPTVDTDAVNRAWSKDAANLSVGTLLAARLPAFTGDATSTAGTSALTLANSGVTAGAYGSATAVPTVTVDAKGRVTTVSTNNITPAGIGAVSTTAVGSANGVCPLGADNLISAQYLPSYVDDIVESNNYAALPTTGETGKIYVTKDTNKTYRWSGSAYVEVNASVGSADTAVKLTTARSISVTGDGTWTTSFDGSANVTATLTLANSGVTAGTFTKVTVDAKGRVTTGANLVQADVTGILGAGSITNTMLANSAVATLSGTNTGDETLSTLKTKLGITTLSGSNTGDQTITLTGDLTGTGTGSFATTLANSGVTAGAYGSATSIPVVTVDAKGRVTTMSTVAVSIPSGAITLSGDVTATGSTGSTTTVTLANSGVTAGTYTKVTVDAKGRVTTGASISATDVTTALTYTPLSLAGGTLTGALTLAADPASALDAATKQYVDNSMLGLDAKASVLVATTANITLSNTQTIDGVAVAVGNRVLVKNQSTTSTNGIYTVTAGAWTRATDLDTWAKVIGSFVFVEKGTTNADTGWLSIADDAGTLGTTAITWSQFSGVGAVTAGTGIAVTGNQVSLAATSVTAASYGSASQVATFTVDAQGRLTTAGSTAISIASSAVSGLSASATTDTTNATNITTGTLADARIATALTGKTYNGISLTSAASGFTVAGGTTAKTLTVSNTLTLAGTDASTLNIGAGGTLGSAAYTASTAYAPAAGSSSITTTGIVTSGTWSGSFGAISGANLTNLNAASLTTGTVPTARLGTGTASATTYLRGDNTWATVSAGAAAVVEVSPSTMFVDDLDTGIDGGTLWNVVDTLDFSATTKGSLFFSFKAPTSWTTGTDIKFDFWFSLNGVDAAKVVKMVASVFVINTSGTANEASPTTTTTDSITSGAGNTGVLAKMLGINMKVAAANFTSTDSIIAVKLTRNPADVADTYNGTLQLAKVIAYQ